jgi:hypothetical protein
MKTVVVALVALVLAPVGVNAAKGPSWIYPLPAPFSQFSDADVLARVFSAYDRSAGRQSEFPNQEGKPAQVRIVEAKPWKSGGQLYLVVFTRSRLRMGPFPTCAACASTTDWSPSCGRTAARWCSRHGRRPDPIGPPAVLAMKEPSPVLAMPSGFPATIR